MNRISNYDELMAARTMTEAIIADRKRIIHEQIEEVKEKIAPFLNIARIFKNKGTNNNPLLKMGASVAIDLLIGQKLLKKAGWITRILVPTLFWITRILVPTLLKTVSFRVIENVKKKNERSNFDPLTQK